MTMVTGGDARRTRQSRPLTRTWWAAACATLGLAALTACSSGGDDPPAATLPPARTVLFLGNSFTLAQGGVDTHFRALAASTRTPHTVTVERVAINGATLADLRSDATVLQAVRAGGHDAVVMQDDIPEYGGPTVEPFKDQVRFFNTEIRAKSGRPVLFMAWAYARLNWITMSTLAQAHKAIGQELSIPVAPVGLAMDASLAGRPTMAMLGPDNEHETLQGAYLAACVLYATIYGETPEGASYVPAGITADEAAFLQRVAWQALIDWNR
jgi:hypothetical protein